jgi:hypothetical protein
VTLLICALALSLALLAGAVVGDTPTFRRAPRD